VTAGDELTRRARDWHHGVQAAACDVVEPWAHGTIVRATRYPEYYDFNAVRVEEDPAMSVDELIALAERSRAGLAPRRVDVEVAEVAESLRAGFEAHGWHAYRPVWMHLEGPPPPEPEIPIEAAPYDEVHALRVAWFHEDFPDLSLGNFLAQARELARRRGAQVLVARAGDAPVGFAQLERDGPAAEITQLYVRPDQRGAGLGTALTRAALRAAGDARDLWIVADADGRARHLYERFGFRPVWTAMELLRLP
jgi:GNAT superfamily N-acetyltransferase